MTNIKMTKNISFATILRILDLNPKDNQRTETYQFLHAFFFPDFGPHSSGENGRLKKLTLSDDQSHSADKKLYRYKTSLQIFMGSKYI